MMRLHLCDECLEALVAPDVMVETLSMAPLWPAKCANEHCLNNPTNTVTRIGKPATDSHGPSNPLLRAIADMDTGAFRKGSITGFRVEIPLRSRA